MVPKHLLRSASALGVLTTAAILLMLGGPPVGSLQAAPSGQAPPAGIEIRAAPSLQIAPDLIVHNGKIMTMDDRSSSSNPGTIVQAMAVRGDRILALGDNQTVLALRGPTTQVVDLQGRTVLPGIIDTHSHFNEYAVDSHGSDLEQLFPTLARIPIDGRSAGEVMANLRQTVETRTAALGPGEWVRLTVRNRPVGLALYVEGAISRAFLDEIAPDNPVHVTIATSHVVNSRGWQEVERAFGRGVDLHPEAVVALGQLPHTPFGRSIGTEVIMRGRPDAVTDLFVYELLEDATYGVTTVSSSISGVLDLDAVQALNRRGELPIRIAWGHSTQPTDPQFYARLGDLRNSDSDYFWNIGVSLGSIDKAFPRICSTVPGVEEQGGICFLRDGSVIRDTLYTMLTNRYRFTNTHVAGDKALDQFFEVLEEASRDANISLDEIRALRHVVDHCTFNPRPDQIARLAHYGIIISCEPKYIYDTSPGVESIFGPEYLHWVVPARSLLEGGVRMVSGVDYHFTPERSIFWLLELYVTRDVDGTVYVPEERIDRVAALKSFTTWAAEYIMREQDLGTLEVGKFADFIVLDRDYFTVPEQDLDQIQVLSTYVGGKAVWNRP